MTMRAAIPQPTRFERAAGKTTAWWPGDPLANFETPRNPPLPYQPGPIVWIVALALGLFIGFCTGAAGVPLPW
jgi:hypothetical protein